MPRTDKPLRRKPRFWRICRIYFRRVRITFWLIILLLVGTLVYLNQVGLPGFVKKPLLARLRERGVELQFSRLRLRWYQGIVADNVRFGRADEPASPQLTVSEVQVHLDEKALRHFQIQVDSLRLHEGRLVWPVAGTNEPPRLLSVTNIQTELRLLPNDQWSLDHFKAGFAGATFEVSGTLSNASAVREWSALRARQPVSAGLWQRRLREFADTLEHIHFPAPPEFRLDVRGDARDLQSFNVHLLVVAPGADTPWGAVSHGRFTARLLPATGRQLSRAEMVIEAQDAQTRWGATTNLQLTIHLASFEGQTNLIHGDLVLQAGNLQTEWASATNAQFTARWVHALTNPIPLTGDGQLRCEQATSRWGRARNLELSGQSISSSTHPLTHAPTHPLTVLADSPYGWWTNLEPYAVTWNARLTDLESPKLSAEEVACAGSWSAPDLAITNLHTKLYHGQINARAELNVATRVVSAGLSSNVDPHALAPLLTPGAQKWLADYSWATPPRLKAEGALVLPAWTNRQPDWRAEVQPTLRLQGEFALEGGGAYRGVQASAARSHFNYSNMVWRLPDLNLLLPGGRLRAEHRASDRTHDFYWHISGTADPLALRPLLATNQLRAFDLFTLSQPPEVEAELYGRFHDPERIGVKGRISATNFTLRGQSISGLQSEVEYTNRILRVIHPRLQRGDERAQADGLTADFGAQVVYLTNGFSTADPLAIARAIGPKVGRTIEPYRFSRPPTGVVYGTIPMHGEEKADLHFDLEGGPFRWSKFKTPRVAGHIHWLGQQLMLTNVDLDLYGGQARGNARFQFHPGSSTDYSFSLTTSNTLLQSLMADLSTNATKLEGRLSGNLTVTKANTADAQHTDGHGQVNLRDGLIWDIPLFGIFSPVLDGLLPGLGSTRINSGACTFVITNSVIRSEDLEMRSSAFRLRYRGTVDFQQNVNARVEAELLRDMWAVGPLVSTVFLPVSKLFEYKVTGTLGHPKKDPLVPVIPKIVLFPFQFPFHPLRTVKGLFPEEPAPKFQPLPAPGTP
jgi:hypothetical protein